MEKAFWIVENGDLVLYKRTGECRQCGQCCCSNLITGERAIGSGEETKEGEEYPDLEGHSAFLDGETWIWLKYTVSEKTRPNGCDSLVDGKCGCHDDKPEACRYWPVHPDNVAWFPDCGYEFEKWIR